MESRRVQVVGRSTYIVSLPKSWIQSVGLKPKSYVYMLERSDGSLILYPSRAPIDRRELTITTTPNERADSLSRKVLAAYLDGYDTVKIKSMGRLTYSQLKEIDEFVKRMSGLEIVEESVEEVTITSIVNVSDFPLEQGFQRAHLITTIMFQEAMNALKKCDAELARSVSLRDGDVDRLYSLVSRQLRAAVLNPSVAKSLNIESLDAIDYLMAIKRVEDAADSIENVAKMVESLNKYKIIIPELLLTDLLRMGGKAFEVYERGVKSFLSRDYLTAREALEAKFPVEEIRCKIEGSLAEQSQQLVLHVGVILINLRNVAYHGGDIAEVAINRAVRSGRIA